MTTRAPFLNTPYGAYHHRDVPQEDTELTHVGPGTPGGEYLRRFWQPVCAAEELTDVPLGLKIMDEELVAFRDLSGRVGVVEMHCPHRGTSLEFGLVSEQGIRCCYHGWLMDVDGKILETPGEPADSTLKDRLCHGAYPALEHKGLVFAYMGPADKKPPFPLYDSLMGEGQLGYRQSSVTGGKHYMPCNWLQIKENSMDPAHTAFLHTIVSGSQFTDEFGIIPELDFLETPLGLVYIALRRVGENIWVRMNDFMAPNVHQVPSNAEDGKTEHPFLRPWLTQWSVPVDDYNTVNLRVRHYTEEEWARPQRPPVLTFGQSEENRTYEERQRMPSDFDAFTNIHWGLSRHGLEHLSTTDRGVIMLRNQVRDGIRAVQAGNDPRELVRNSDVVRTYANDTVVRVPPASTEEADTQLVRETGRRVAQAYIDNPPPLG